MLGRFFQGLLSPEQIINLKKKRAILECPRRCHVATKSIFVHVPKAAGISVVNSIYGVDESTHDSWREHRLRSKYLWNKAFKFSFVRDPVDRMISAYYYLMAGGRTYSDKYWKANYLAEFDDLNHFVLGGGLERAVNYAEHFYPQSYFLCNKNNEIMVDFVGRYENLEADFKYVADRIFGGDLQLSFKNVNASNKTDGLSEEAEKMVRSIYCNDFMVFDYK
ncbi:sulfotransferase family 2 domain-containing protein [Zhongshania aliphaticivorans]|nr:sulfotransferase family 2 domain-containing protein [Zhongshania aliphaticivorans]